MLLTQRPLGLRTGASLKPVGEKGNPVSSSDRRSRESKSLPDAFPCVRQAFVRTGAGRDGRLPALRRQTKNWPPLALMVDPVMKPASSEARKATIRAISEGSPRRPTGICGMIRSFSTFSSMARTISVPI
jgi:hypothetical protein